MISISSSSLTRAARLLAAKVGGEAAATPPSRETGRGAGARGEGGRGAFYLQRVKYSGSSGTGKSRLHNRLSLGTGGRELEAPPVAGLEASPRSLRLRRSPPASASFKASGAQPLGSSSDLGVFLLTTS